MTTQASRRVESDCCGKRHDAQTAYRLLARGEAADGLCVTGLLDYSMASGRVLPTRFPENLQVDVLDLSDREIETLPRGPALDRWKIIGNIHDPDWAAALTVRPCPKRTCRCYLGRAQFALQLERIFGSRLLERIPLRQ